MNTQEYDFDTIANDLFAPIYPDIAKVMVERTGVSAGRLLDVGCGGGHMGFAVMALGDFTADFCDIEPKAVFLAARRAGELGLSQKVSVHTADVHALPFPDRTFNLIVSRGSMPFWSDQKKAFHELYRVLRPGGWAYIGGGLGGARHQKPIREQMERQKLDMRCFSRERLKTLSTEEYIRLFQKLHCAYRVIENPDEGRWFIFGKDRDRNE